MSREQLVSTDAREVSRAQPHIEYDPKLYASDVPYNVVVNAGAFTKLLVDLILTDDQIQSTRLVISTQTRSPIKYLGVKPLGEANPWSNSIKIYCDPIWENYKNQLAIAKRIAIGKERKGLRGKWDIYKLNANLQTKILPAYLRSVSPGRSLPFAYSLLSKARNATNSGTILHEVQHVLDVKYQPDKRVVALSIGGKMATFPARVVLAYVALNIDSEPARTLGLATAIVLPAAQYLIDPAEKKARKFAKANQRNPEYRNLLSLSPRNG